ncbi:MAG: 50S ribosomal protein L30e [Candidatus Bathyarchaeia archaeon]
MDIEKQLPVAIKTGKVEFGSKRALEAVAFGKAKMVILASNMPEEERKEIERLAKLSNLPVRIYNGSGRDLGSLCGRPFAVLAVTIKDPGDSMLGSAEGQI